MSETLKERVGKLKAALETIEREVVATPTSRDTLEDFKLAVDHIRISVWAILTEQHKGGHQLVVTQFRMKRIMEMCRHLVADIDAGAVPVDETQLEQFRNVLENTAGRVARLISLR